MKVTYMEQISNYTAFSRKMYCPKCGGHEYNIIKQLQPETSTPWYVECAQCEFEGPASPTRKLAIFRWKQVC